eukprot:jgi/Galph1/2700/GphlegSOOS_G1361.1
MEGFGGLDAVDLQGELFLPSPPRRKHTILTENLKNSTESQGVVNAEKAAVTSSTSKNSLDTVSLSRIQENKVSKETYMDVSTKTFKEDERQRVLQELEQIDEMLSLKKGELRSREKALEFRKKHSVGSFGRLNTKESHNLLPKFTERVSQVTSELLLDTVVKGLLLENRLRAASSHAALQPYFSQVFEDEKEELEKGLFAPYPPFALYCGPEDIESVQTVVEDFKKLKTRVAEHIVKKRQKKLEDRKQLTDKFMELREKWIKQLRSHEEQLSRKEAESLLQRDCDILLAMQGSEALLTRTGSGRATYRSSLNAPESRSVSLEDVSIFLNAIEADGGTAGGRSRWGKCLARIPPQDISSLPFDGGAVLLQDPLFYHHACCAINPWTVGERSIFIKRFAQYGKNFRKIASFLKYKTTEDVVRFYFQNKIRLELKKYFRGCDVSTRKRFGRRNVFIQNNKFSSEVAPKSPFDIGSPETILTSYGESPTWHSTNSESGLESSRSSSPVSSTWTFEEVERLSQALTKHGLHFKLVAKDVGTKTAMQCRTYWKHNRESLNVSLEQPPTSGGMKKETSIESHIYEPKPERKKQRRRVLEWSPEEKVAFKQYFEAFGCNWDRLAELIPTKSSLQIRTYYEELVAASRLDMEPERVSPPSLGMKVSSDDFSREHLDKESYEQPVKSLLGISECVNNAMSHSGDQPSGEGNEEMSSELVKTTETVTSFNTFSLNSSVSSVTKEMEYNVKPDMETIDDSHNA